MYQILHVPAGIYLFKVNNRNTSSTWFWCQQISHIVLVFFNCYLAAPQSTLDHSQGDSFTNSMLITACYLFRPEGHREPRSEVGSLSQAERFYCWLGTSICRLGLFKKKSVILVFENHANNKLTITRQMSQSKE